MTECNQPRLESKAPDGRTFTAAFDGGNITSDGGIPLLRLVDDRCKILERFGQCFTDYRDPTRIQFTATQLATQRVLSVALGYEDLNDHDILRSDPLLAAAVGANPRTGSKLASSATLGRIENAALGLAHDGTEPGLFPTPSTWRDRARSAFASQRHRALTPS